MDSGEIKLGCIAFPIVPGRREPNDRSEMVTQLLFGENYKVLEENKKWILIRNELDKYECWIDRKQHTEVANSIDLNETLKSPLSSIECNGEFHQIPMGSHAVKGKFAIGGIEYSFHLNESSTDKNPLDFGKELLGAPYLWGGKSILGVDCSGLAQVAFSCAGIQLPRDAYQQAEYGETVDFIETAKPGDLAFFDNEEGRITHVGILTGEGTILHASGSVRIEKIDHEGIFDGERYTHSLRIIKRLAI